ncbi:hypothetical protein [Halobacillus naozhouensis]|uniref:Uncharacterized protein n=1 Tax=Halobacillus naozhouensis TaxID=554880 RepID=A0ABY8J4Z7_9BACI|nr:hypothetical protein [Halobacillus naozhouensis]WFT75830.1 hypothetical protein P9989_05455 [Halobacillus naozhouensis]
MSIFTNWDRFFPPLYIPAYTAWPAAAWLIFKPSEWEDVEIVLLILLILFLAFAGAVEINSDEKKHRWFGYLYLSSSLLISIAGLCYWLV